MKVRKERRDRKVRREVDGSGAINIVATTIAVAIAIAATRRMYSGMYRGVYRRVYSGVHTIAIGTIAIVHDAATSLSLFMLFMRRVY